MSTTAYTQPMPHQFSARRWILRICITLIAFGVLSSALWGVHRWWTYPQVPNVATADIHASLSFMGSDEFNRMFERHRLEYALAVVDKLGESSFTDLMHLFIRRDENRARVARNIRAIKGYDQIGSRMFAMFLDKFYQQSDTERGAALLVIALAQQGQIMTNPEQFGLPTVDEFKRDMGRFLSRQPPRTQAMFGQFLIDLKRQRDAMGLRDPF